MTSLASPGRPRRFGRRAADRLVRRAEALTGDTIDARLRRVPTPQNEVGHDPFGFDPDTTRVALAGAALLHRRYFRTEVFGLERVPLGRVMIVANHAGQVPIDGMLLATALMLDAEPPRFARSMVERWTAELPFVSVFFPRVGQVLGAPDNARRLLENEEALLVFPEGVRGISKTFDQRYRLQAFGRGFMRLAMATSTPIVPVAVIGSEEQYPSVANLGRAARRFGMPSLPLLPQLLVGMPLPLPARYRLHFGHPMRFVGDPDDEDAVIGVQVDRVRGALAGLLHEGLAARRGVFV
ncbi:MAG: lysophospholipid acyltransferase family protein [Myxococcota bacterium]